MGAYPGVSKELPPPLAMPPTMGQDTARAGGCLHIPGGCSPPTWVLRGGVGQEEASSRAVAGAVEQDGHGAGVCHQERGGGAGVPAVWPCRQGWGHEEDWGSLGTGVGTRTLGCHLPWRSPHQVGGGKGGAQVFGLCLGWSQPQGDPTPRVAHPQGSPNPRVVPAPGSSQPQGSYIRTMGGTWGTAPRSSPCPPPPPRCHAVPPQPQAALAELHRGWSWTRLPGEHPKMSPHPQVGTDRLLAGQGPTPPQGLFIPPWLGQHKWPPALIGCLPPRPPLLGLPRMAWPHRTPKWGLRPHPLPVFPFTGTAEAAF